MIIFTAFRFEYYTDLVTFQKFCKEQEIECYQFNKQKMDILIPYEQNLNLILLVFGDKFKLKDEFYIIPNHEITFTNYIYQQTKEL